MWDKLKASVLKELLSSKKAVMTIVGVIVTFIIVPIANNRLGLNLSPEAMSETLYPFIAYVIGQGLADFGKEKPGAGFISGTLVPTEPFKPKPRRRKVKTPDAGEPVTMDVDLSDAGM